MRKFALLLAVTGLLAGGCAPAPKPMYYWGKYSHSLYDCKKKPCDETMNKHKECLLDIVQKSNEKGLRVPPGIYCELGYTLLQEGKKEEGIKYLALEKETYPESAVLVDRLMAKLAEEK